MKRWWRDFWRRNAMHARNTTRPASPTQAIPETESTADAIDVVRAGDGYAVERFCKDCQYCRIDGNDLLTPALRLTYAACHHPEARLIDDTAYAQYLVTSVLETKGPRFDYCSSMRQRQCGETARLFAARDK